jgi:regulator of cell morphogenesis and NO signaling
MSNPQNDTRALADAGLESLVNYILDKHHKYTYAAFDRLSAAMVTAKKSADAPPELGQVSEIVNALRMDLLAHMPKEERILFPYVASLDRAEKSGGPAPRAMFGTVANPIRMMSMEHDNATKLLSDLRLATRDFAPPANASAEIVTLYRGLAELDADLVEHMGVENDLLFPRAVQLETQLRSR